MALSSGATVALLGAALSTSRLEYYMYLGTSLSVTASVNRVLVRFQNPANADDSTNQGWVRLAGDLVFAGMWIPPIVQTLGIVAGISGATQIELLSVAVIVTKYGLCHILCHIAVQSHLALENATLHFHGASNGQHYLRLSHADAEPEPEPKGCSCPIIFWA